MAADRVLGPCSVTLFGVEKGEGVATNMSLSLSAATFVSLGPREMRVEALAVVDEVLKLQRSAPAVARVCVEWTNGPRYEFTGMLSWNVSIAPGDVARLELTVVGPGREPIDVSTFADDVPVFMQERAREAGGEAYTRTEIFGRGPSPSRLPARAVEDHGGTGPEVEGVRERVIRLDPLDPSDGGAGK